MSSLQEQVEAFEQSTIERALALTDGNVRAAAKALKMPERTLWDKLTKHKIDANHYRPNFNADIAGIKKLSEYVQEVIDVTDPKSIKKGIDLDYLAERLFYGGFEPMKIKTAAAIWRALQTGKTEHI